MLLMCKKTTNSPLGDGTCRRHKTFTNSVAGFGRRWLPLFVTHENDQSILKWMIVFPFHFPFWQPFANDLGSWRWRPLLSFYLRAATNTLTRAFCLATSISAKGKRWMLNKQMERSRLKEWCKKITYAVGSKCLICNLQASTQDHRSRRAMCQGWSGPCTSVHRRGFQEPDGWKSPARRLCTDER